jgi:hypothetical protein
MGLIDRFAKKVASEIEKAPRLPAGAVAMTEADMRQAGLVAQQTYGNSVALPRSPFSATVPFGPGMPITPGAINPVREDGRPDPRRYEYQVAQNINVTETRFIPFKTLRASADQIDILRRCIEVIKNKVVSLDFDIVLGQDASEKIIASSDKDHIRAMAEARKRFTEDIDRIRTFWENPDRSNGLTFADWINTALEEILVIDAWAVWPQKTVGGDLYGLQILDGGTIKPLLDDRGMRPTPPNVAFQQILYGFPRSEFTANDDDPNADGDFTSDDLQYMVRNRRTISVYGFSPVERALPLADIYLRRQQWIRAEYTDGVVPELFFESDINFGTNAQLIRDYENIINDDLSGQTQQRMRARILPAGLKPFQPDGYGEKFKDTLDEFLIASICGHFGVQPTEIGYNPKGGLGGAGFEEGKAASASAIGVEPLIQWLNKMLTNISYTYLGMPRELEFKLLTSRRADDESNARKSQIEITSAGKTINERRSEIGLPLLDTPQADMPILVAGAEVLLFSPEGIINAKEVLTASTLDQQGNVQSDGSSVQNDSLPISDNGEGAPEEPEDNDDEVIDAEVEAEVKAFMKWANKGKRNRQFEFHKTDMVVAEALNRCAFEGDLETARSIAKAFLS